MLRRTLFLVVGIVLGVSGFAQAQNLIQISDTQTWADFDAGGFDGGDTLQILAGGDLTVTGRSRLRSGRHLIVEEGGRFTINARMDMDSEGQLTMNGGEFHNTVDFKFPDSSGDQDVHIWLNGGLMVCERIQSMRDRGSVLHVGGGVLRVGNTDAGGEYDPENTDEWAIVPIPPRPTVTIVDLGGGWKEVSAGSPFTAYPDNPADGATDVVRDPTLIWVPAPLALTHDVYFGTDAETVGSASRSNPMDVLMAEDQAASTFDPGLLEYGQEYYWRVDEVNDADPDSPWKGAVWSFTAEPYAYPIENVTATASSAQAGMGPERTVDGSGLNSDDQHSVDAKDMWLSMGTAPNWIQYQFDKPYILHEMWVWNSNQVIESIPGFGFGAKSVKIEYSVDGDVWTELTAAMEFAQGTGLPTYASDTTVSFGGAIAQYVKLTIDSTWGGAPQCGLSEVRFLSVPVQARAPEPANEATGVGLDVTLNWRPGRQAASHQVYFDTDGQAVADGTAFTETVANHSYSLSALQLETTYYWRVDGVNDVPTPASWVGEVWSFTTQQYAVVDDCESYTDDFEAGEAIWQTWIDGLEDPQKGGSQVGYSEAPFAELTIVHGGSQSMPLTYDNTAAAYSEATRTFDASQNWTASGIKSLSLYLQGAAGNTGQLYLKINDTKVPYNGNAGDIARSAWVPWNIDLSTVGGNLSNVAKLTIGVEGAGAKGILYIDDIRLYPRTPEYITPTDPGQANLVALYAFEGSANDTSGHGLNGTLRQAGLVNSGRPNGGSAVELTKLGHVDLGNPPLLDFGTGDWTVTAWFKTAMTGTGDANKGTIYAKGGDASGGHRYTLCMSEVTEGAVSLVCDDDATKEQVHSVSKTNDDRWHFVVGQREGTAIKIYIDGHLEGTEPVAADYNLSGTSQHKAYIGAITNHGDGSLYKLFDGLIDDVHVYDRALSAPEILWVYGQTTPVAEPF
jgi:hypothetical protein